MPEKLADVAMNHRIYRVMGFEHVAPYSLCLRFSDGSMRTINFESIPKGELHGPLRDPVVFARATLDSEVHTIVWPDGADFDPATLHGWSDHEASFRVAADLWSGAGQASTT